MVRRKRTAASVRMAKLKDASDTDTDDVELVYFHSSDSKNSPNQRNTRSRGLRNRSINAESRGSRDTHSSEPASRISWTSNHSRSRVQRSFRWTQEEVNDLLRAVHTVTGGITRDRDFRTNRVPWDRVCELLEHRRQRTLTPANLYTKWKRLPDSLKYSSQNEQESNPERTDSSDSASSQNQTQREIHSSDVPSFNDSSQLHSVEEIHSSDLPESIDSSQLHCVPEPSSTRKKFVLRGEVQQPAAKVVDLTDLCSSSPCSPTTAEPTRPIETNERPKRQTSTIVGHVLEKPRKPKRKAPSYNTTDRTEMSQNDIAYSIFCLERRPHVKAAFPWLSRSLQNTKLEEMWRVVQDKNPLANQIFIAKEVKRADFNEVDNSIESLAEKIVTKRRKISDSEASESSRFTTRNTETELSVDDRSYELVFQSMKARFDQEKQIYEDQIKVLTDAVMHRYHVEGSDNSESTIVSLRTENFLMKKRIQVLERKLGIDVPKKRKRSTRSAAKFVGNAISSSSASQSSSSSKTVITDEKLPNGCVVPQATVATTASQPNGKSCISTVGGRNAHVMYQSQSRGSPNGVKIAAPPYANFSDFIDKYPIINHKASDPPSYYLRRKAKRLNNALNSSLSSQSTGSKSVNRTTSQASNSSVSTSSSLENFPKKTPISQSVEVAPSRPESVCANSKIIKRKSSNISNGKHVVDSDSTESEEESFASEEEVYDVEKILDSKTGSDNETLYLVKWVGWDDPTWEPKGNLLNCDVALSELKS
eukprot:228763_1